jgi:hypothetical protein
MIFDLNERGNIDSKPLLRYQSAVIADVACLIRVVLATQEDQPETNTISFQMTMSAEQAESLAEELQRMAEHIRAHLSRPSH